MDQYQNSNNFKTSKDFTSLGKNANLVTSVFESDHSKQNQLLRLE